MFCYGATNWFPVSLAQWAAAHQVSGAALTDGLISMAIMMVLVRTLGLFAGPPGSRAALPGRRPTAPVP